jgi:hypothetical protein
LPAGATLSAGGHLVLWCDGNPSAGWNHLAFTLNAAGGALGLARPDGSFIDKVVYGAQAVDLSAAREPDGSDKWVTEWNVTVGSANPDAGGHPVAVKGLSAAPEQAPAAGDLTEEIHGYDLIPAFDLKISDAGVASLAAQPDLWVQATLGFRGRDYGPVGVNLKGHSSFEPIQQKPGFRVSVNKFVKGARFFGIKEFLLNNLATDGSMMHERLAYWIARQVGGVPASRCNHAVVRLNGSPLGLYANVEEPKQPLMARFFADATGPVYTIDYADFQKAYLSTFVLQDGVDDLSRIVGLTDALALQPIDAAMTAAAQYANLHEFARYWALMVLTGHWGGWPYAPDPEPVGANAGIYLDPSTKQLYFIPEGINDAFATADFDFIKNAKSVLARSCALSASCYGDFAAQLMELMNQAEQLDWASEHDRIAAQIAPFTVLDHRKPYTDADVAMFQTQMRYFLTGRRSFLAKYLSPPSATAFPSTP